MLEIGWTTWMFQVVNVLILTGWIILTTVALMRVRRCQLDETARVLWAIVIVLIPFLGALAFFVVNPGKSWPGEER